MQIFHPQPPRGRSGVKREHAIDHFHSLEGARQSKEPRVSEEDRNHVGSLPHLLKKFSSVKNGEFLTFDIYDAYEQKRLDCNRMNDELKHSKHIIQELKAQNTNQSEEMSLTHSEGGNLGMLIEEDNETRKDLIEKHAEIVIQLQSANQTIATLRNESNKDLKMAEKERDVQSLNQVNELLEVTLKEKDQQLEREREAKRLMKIEIDESKEVIKTLKIENTNVTQKHTDIMAKLKENNKIVDKLRTSNEKNYRRN